MLQNTSLVSLSLFVRWPDTGYASPTQPLKYGFNRNIFNTEIWFFSTWKYGSSDEILHTQKAQFVSWSLSLLTQLLNICDFVYLYLCVFVSLGICVFMYLCIFVFVSLTDDSFYFPTVVDPPPFICFSPPNSLAGIFSPKK